MTNHHGGPAFPQHKNGVGGQTIASEGGMSLRDYFAGQALAALASNDRLGKKYQSDWFAKAAYVMADAMIAARGSDND